MIGLFIWGLIISAMLCFITYKKTLKVNSFVIRPLYCAICFLFFMTILSDNVPLFTKNSSSFQKNNTILNSSSAKLTNKIGDKIYVRSMYYTSIYGKKYYHKTKSTYSVKLLDIKPVICIDDYSCFQGKKRLIAAKYKIDDIQGDDVYSNAFIDDIRFHTTDGKMYYDKSYKNIINLGEQFKDSYVSISTGNSYEGWDVIEIPSNIKVTRIEIQNVDSWYLNNKI